jgi:hypothetical protein
MRSHSLHSKQTKTLLVCFFHRKRLLLYTYMLKVTCFPLLPLQAYKLSRLGSVPLLDLLTRIPHLSSTPARSRTFLFHILCSAFTFAGLQA